MYTLSTAQPHIKINLSPFKSRQYQPDVYAVCAENWIDKNLTTFVWIEKKSREWRRKQPQWLENSEESIMYVYLKIMRTDMNERRIKKEFSSYTSKIWEKIWNLDDSKLKISLPHIKGICFTKKISSLWVF